jgi:hypothetical protein
MRRGVKIGVGAVLAVIGALVAVGSIAQIGACISPPTPPDDGFVTLCMSETAYLIVGTFVAVIGLVIALLPVFMLRPAKGPVTGPENQAGRG